MRADGPNVLGGIKGGSKPACIQIFNSTVKNGVEIKNTVGPCDFRGDIFDNINVVCNSEVTNNIKVEENKIFTSIGDDPCPPEGDLFDDEVVPFAGGNYIPKGDVQAFKNKRYNNNIVSISRNNVETGNIQVKENVGVVEIACNDVRENLQAEKNTNSVGNVFITCNENTSANGEINGSLQCKENTAVFGSGNSFFDKYEDQCKNLDSPARCFTICNNPDES